jgi:hypothetical protein
MCGLNWRKFYSVPKGGQFRIPRWSLWRLPIDSVRQNWRCGSAWRKERDAGEQFRFPAIYVQPEPLQGAYHSQQYLFIGGAASLHLDEDATNCWNDVE